MSLGSVAFHANSCGAGPHRQGRDTKIAMLSFGGIDVSDRLDVIVAGATLFGEQWHRRLG